ncbi:MAG: HD domain-containing protein [Sideroxydans sp.]|nr:HD domain-containing protein [Sideroxydans sp.]
MRPNDPIINILYGYTKALSVALGYRDPLTRQHSERVRDIATAMGSHLGLTGQTRDALMLAASFHDIGKIGIPDHILMKSTPFTADEWETMKTHSEIGERIIASVEIEGAAQAAKVIRHHHEYFNGRGYPDGLAGTDIPICSRITAIADNYDAMAVTRSYHSARPHEQIMEIMREETGSKLDPDLMDVFHEVIESEPFKQQRAAPRS